MITRVADLLAETLLDVRVVRTRAVHAFGHQQTQVGTSGRLTQVRRGRIVPLPVVNCNARNIIIIIIIVGGCPRRGLLLQPTFDAGRIDQVLGDGDGNAATEFVLPDQLARFPRQPIQLVFEQVQRHGMVQAFWNPQHD